MKYGAINAIWAKMESDASSSALPTYATQTYALDGVNESNDTINYAEGSAYGDNKKKINIKEFSDGSIAAKFVWLPVDTASAILGTATDGENGQSFGGEDDPPYGGYGFISNRMDSNKNKFYEVVFYPKVQGSASSESYKTKENSITLEYDSISFDLLQPECGLYKLEKRFEDKSAAIGYLEGLFAGTSVAPGLETKTTE